MTLVVLSERARHDLLRLADFLANQDPHAANATADLIVEALRLLQRHPRVGRRATPLLRELVIQRGRTGYVALYRVDAADRCAEVLAIRHQRESGYHPDDL
jgi:plasmid stabilization system protein ParE